MVSPENESKLLTEERKSRGPSCNPGPYSASNSEKSSIQSGLVDGAAGIDAISGFRVTLDFLAGEAGVSTVVKAERTRPSWVIEMASSTTW
jgi:hypothetical protein